MVRGRVVVLISILVAPYIYLQSLQFIAPPFWDARIYADAIIRFVHGGSPYDAHNQLPFIYPPLFLIVGSWLSRLLTPAIGWKLFILANFFSVTVIPFVLARFYVKQRGIECFILYLLTPMALTEEIFFGGNVASLCYCAALLAGARGLSRGRWILFYATVGLAATVKITFLALLLLPLMVQAGQAIASTITAATTCITYLAQQIFLPDLYQSFEGALSHQTFGARNYGIAPFGVTANLLHRFHENGFIIPGGTQVLFAGMVVLALGGIRNRIDTKDPRWLALVVIAIALINPLMFDYDITTAVIPSYFLLFSNLDRRGTWVLLTICCAGFFIGHGAIGFLFLLVSAFAVGLANLGSEVMCKVTETIVPKV